MRKWKTDPRTTSGDLYHELECRNQDWRRLWAGTGDFCNCRRRFLPQHGRIDRGVKLEHTHLSGAYATRGGAFSVERRRDPPDRLPYYGRGELSRTVSRRAGQDRPKPSGRSETDRGQPPPEAASRCVGTSGQEPARRSQGNDRSAPEQGVGGGYPAPLDGAREG